ncbi:MAG: hypothetical protein JJU24_15535, partial [Natronohydrobacter sp.]|nr:hypothetical protein [Natronohydrobacter sp.]
PQNRRLAPTPENHSIRDPALDPRKAAETCRAGFIPPEPEAPKRRTERQQPSQPAKSPPRSDTGKP